LSAPGGLARAAGLSALAFVGLMAVPQPAAADTTIEVTTPAEGYHQTGAATPLLVTIQADRALSGTLSANFDGSFGGAQRIEVPGGSAKEVVFLVTTPPWSTQGQVTFDGAETGDNASARINLKTAGTDEIVAVLPSLAVAREVPASAELAIEVGVARLFPLDTVLLSAGPDVLTPFSQLLASAADLEALDDTQLEAVRTWLGTYGGTLVLDEAPGTPTPLDEGGDLIGTGSDVIYGVGQIRYTQGEATAGRYDGLLRPTVTRSSDEFPFGPAQFGAFPTTITLASDAGVRIPAIGSLVGILLVYVVVVGPLLWLVLRRTRRETMLWAVLPALALLTTLAVYGIGRAMRSEASAAHATVVADLPATRIISSQVLVTSPNGGRAGVELDEAWRPLSILSDEMFFGFGPGGAAPARTQSLDGSDLIIDLPAGGVGVVSAETTQPAAEPSWDFDLEATDEGLEGTVTNLTDLTLDEVYVTSGQGFTRIARIGPGEAAQVTLRGSNRPVITSDRFSEQLMGNGDPMMVNDKGINPGMLSNWLGRRPGLRAPGYVMAVGWTRDLPSPLTTIRGQSVSSGRTAYLTAERVDTEDMAQGGRLELLRGMSTRVVDTPPPGTCTDISSTIRLTPGAVEGEGLPVLAVSTRAVTALDIWVGDRWLPAGLGQIGAGQNVALSLPPPSLDDGSLYARLQMNCDFWGIADPFPTLRPAEADDVVVDLTAAGDEGQA
jgi:hypothetical protein